MKCLGKVNHCNNPSCDIHYPGLGSLILTPACCCLRPTRQSTTLTCTTLTLLTSPHDKLSVLEDIAVGGGQHNRPARGVYSGLDNQDFRQDQNSFVHCSPGCCCCLQVRPSYPDLHLLPPSLPHGAEATQARAFCTYPPCATQTPWTARCRRARTSLTMGARTREAVPWRLITPRMTRTPLTPWWRQSAGRAVVRVPRVVE